MQYCKKFNQLIKGACALIFAMLTFSASAQEVIIDESSFERVESARILEYRQFSSLLGESHAITLQVYGDGTITATFPLTHSRAGSYSFTLPAPELDALIASVLESNEQVETSAQSQTNENTLFAVSDSTFTEIDLNIASYSLDTGESIALDSTVAIREQNLLQASQQFTGPNRLTKLSELENNLLELTQDSRLVRQ